MFNPQAAELKGIHLDFDLFVACLVDSTSLKRIIFDHGKPHGGGRDVL